MDLVKVLNNDMSGLTHEEIEKANNFNEKLREKLINELVIYEGEDLINKYKESKDKYFDKIEQIFFNGIKGYKDFKIKQLIDIYLDKKTEEDFMKIVNSCF